MDFSLFYFADGVDSADGRYRLLLDGARFADEHGFAAVWTPERHFHEFGGRYPNPAVTAAAVAAVTERVEIRAGSVVAPLHHPVRIAEEWSVVDNLSGGRAGLSFASGWHSVDFVLRPENYADRRKITSETVKTVRRLWSGGDVEFPDAEGAPVPVRVFPPPVRPELPIWLTSGGTASTLLEAAELGTGVLTHLLGQDLAELKRKLLDYRAAFRSQHPEAGSGHVALMLHTYIGTDREQVREIVREPFKKYLRSSVGLMVRAAHDVLPGLNPDDLDPEDVNFLVDKSFDRYFETGGLFGTVDDAMATVRQLADIGVDEVACLIDFVDDETAVVAGLPLLNEVRERWSAATGQA